MPSILNVLKGQYASESRGFGEKVVKIACTLFDKTGILPSPKDGKKLCAYRDIMVSTDW